MFYHIRVLSVRVLFVCLLSWCQYDGVTHWGRVTHICVSKLTIIGSDNGLSPGRRQAIIWTNAGILLIRPIETNFSEILLEIHTFSFKRSHLKMSSGKWRPSCLGLNVLMHECSMSIANALEILQSCTKPSKIGLLEIQVLSSLLTPAADTGSPLVLPVTTNYRQTSNIRRTLEGNKLVDHSDVVGASPVGAAPTPSSFWTWLQWIQQRQLQDETGII